MSQCQAMIKTGQRQCRNKAIKDSSFCQAHQPKQTKNLYQQIKQYYLREDTLRLV